MALTSAPAPAITRLPGALKAATDTLSAWGAISRCTSAASPCTATMAPPAGSACIRRPRAAIRRAPSSRLNTPATTAAANSPTLWPITTVGSMPQLRQVAASATSMANSAGCVKPVWSRLPPVSSNITSRSGLPSKGSSTAAQRSIVARNTGSASYSSRPMPTYCAPCPVKRKATRLRPLAETVPCTADWPVRASSRSWACMPARSAATSTVRSRWCDRPMAAVAHTSASASAGRCSRWSA